MTKTKNGNEETTRLFPRGAVSKASISTTKVKVKVKATLKTKDAAAVIVQPKVIAVAKARVEDIAVANRGRKGVRCRNLSNEQRASLLQSLLKYKTSGGNTNSNSDSNTNSNSHINSNSNSNNKIDCNSNSVKSRPRKYKLRKGALLEASKAFGVSTKTCKRIWERYLETAADDDVAKGSGGDVSHRKHRSGRPKKISAEELLVRIQELPEDARSSIRGMARALGMPHTTIHRRLMSGEIPLDGYSSRNNCSTSTKRSSDDSNVVSTVVSNSNVDSNSNAVSKEVPLARSVSGKEDEKEDETSIAASLNTEDTTRCTRPIPEKSIASSS